MKDPKRQAKLDAFDRLLTIMDELREQCPWDQKQTIQSLRHLTIEETYELADAITNNDLEEVKKEIGDIMLHLVFYARIASETNVFDIADVLNSLCEKMIRRHPHIYGDVKAETPEQVKQNWEQIKLKEKDSVVEKTVLGGVPKSLPALVKAYRIQEKAAAVGFDWDKKEDVWEKVLEELQEFKDETEAATVSKDKVEGEFGDLIFALINYARFENVNAEDALDKTNKKFISRFNYLEAETKKAGKNLADMTLTEMDEYWNAAKKFED